MNQVHALRYSIFFLFFIFSFSKVQCAAYKQIIVVYHDNSIDKRLIKNSFSHEVFIDSLTFESDVFFQQEEFFYLMDFAPGDCIDASRLIAATERLVKKNKFLIIKISYLITDKGIQLHYSFESAWTFKKVKIHKVYQGKQQLFQHYVMERGDIFDHEKHEHSLTKIKDFLMQEGYYEPRIKSWFEYDYITKEVTVHIAANKGNCFVFGAMNVELSTYDVSNENSDLQQLIHKRLSQRLSGSYARKELLTQEIEQLKDYLAKKGFLQITVEWQKEIDKHTASINVLWKISLYQKRSIVFFGQQFFSKKELLDKILAFGRSAWLLPASLLAEEIIREYKNKGFWNVEVITQEEKERIFFIIKEGPRAHIASVVINNAIYGDEEYIKKRCFGALLKHSYYDVWRYDEAIGLLTKFYVDNGFLSCVVVDHNFIPGQRENEYILVVTIDEGVQKHVTSATVMGYPELNIQGPFGKVSLEKPLLFDMKLLEEQRVWLSDHFQRLGYLHPRAKSIIEAHGSDVSIQWQIDCGERIRFGKTIIVGSSTFPFPYIASVLDYRHSDLWDQKKIKKTFVKFKELEIFETIHFMPDYTECNEEKPVIMRLHLDDRYEIRARAGLELQHVQKYQTFSGVTYKVGGTALIKNPCNYGDQVRLDLDLARSHREIVGRYRRPWFIRWPCITLFQVYSISYDQPGFIGSFNDIYRLIQNGFFFGLQKKTDHCDIGFNNGFEWMKIHINNNEGQLSFAQAINFKPQLIDKMVPFFFIEPTIMVESIDNPLYPRHGGISLFSLKGMIPMVGKYKDSIFFKLLFEQSLFVPISFITMALRFRCGHIFYHEFSAIMPSERFYLGGSHSLRGYEADLAPPLGIFVDDEGHRHLVPRGGRTMVNTNVELRVPVYKKVGAVIFQDLGVLSGTMFADFKPQDILAATGFGIRFFTPLGPLRFDIGWRWRKQIPIERSFAWFLTFGQAF